MERAENEKAKNVRANQVSTCEADNNKSSNSWTAKTETTITTVGDEFKQNKRVHLRDFSFITNDSLWSLIVININDDDDIVNTNISTFYLFHQLFYLSLHKDSKNISLAGEQKDQKEYLDNVVYTNPPTAHYFTQFNTTTR